MTGKTSLWRHICLICTAHDNEHNEHAGTTLILQEWNKNMAHWRNDTDREETTVLGHSANLSTTNPTRNPPGLIPGLCGEKPVTDWPTTLSLFSLRMVELIIMYISDASAGFCLCQHEEDAKTNCWRIKMICCWNFHKHNILHTAYDLETLPWKMLGVQHMVVKYHYIDSSMEETLQLPGFVPKCQNVLLVLRHPHVVWTVPWVNNSTLHTLDCLQWHDLWMFPFQHLTFSVDVQVLQELTVWCTNLEILSKLRPSVRAYNMCIRHALPSDKRQFCIYGCILDLTFAQKLSNSAHVLKKHSACFFTETLWMSLLWVLAFQLGTKQTKTWILMSYACLKCIVAKNEELVRNFCRILWPFYTNCYLLSRPHCFILSVINLCLPKCGQMSLLWSLQFSRRDARWRWCRRRGRYEEFT